MIYGVYFLVFVFAFVFAFVGFNNGLTGGVGSGLTGGVGSGLLVVDVSGSVSIMVLIAGVL
tara:strand:+ start:101 stop:283 length:183 start_codon:yes stop_codon:yes gene_type:complete